jgi:hypothetical protein
MSDNLMPAQETNIELSEQDLEAVAGGTYKFDYKFPHYASSANGVANSDANAVGENAHVLTAALTSNHAGPGFASSHSTAAGQAIAFGGGH